MTDKPDLYPPAAYIIGAPKCGTTALADYLADHPDICFSNFKEPHFFAEDMKKLSIHESETEYKADFPEPQTENSVLMEGSVFYLLSGNAVRNIQQRRPDARFIVMLRDPVAMAPSLHQQMLNSLDEDVKDFEVAWRLSDARGRGEKLPAFCRSPDMVRYPVACALGAQVARLFAEVPPERRLVMLQDELRVDAGGVYRRALDFLGLPDDGRTEFPRINEAIAAKWRFLRIITQRPWPLLHGAVQPIKRALGVKSLGVMYHLNKANVAPTGGARISPAMAAELAAYFRDDIDRLSSLLGKDLVGEYGWLGSGTGHRAAS